MEIRGREMTIYADLTKGIMTVNGREIKISCKVRNEINGQRSLKERPVLSIPDRLPVMPRPFPVGRWEVLDPLPRATRELAPFFIPTTAYRILPVWKEVDGHYGERTNNTTIDRGYGLHYSEYVNTIGCIKIENKADLLWLVDLIVKERKVGKVFLEVV